MQTSDQMDGEDRQLCMLTVNGDNNVSSEASAEWSSGEQLVLKDSALPQLSLHALTGICSFSTMRIKGSKGTITLFLLIDSGSSHNFLDSKLAKQFGCELDTIPALKISVANGKS